MQLPADGAARSLSSDAGLSARRLSTKRNRALGCPTRLFREQSRNTVCHAPTYGSRARASGGDGSMAPSPEPMRGSIDRRATRLGSAGASSSQLLLLLPLHTHRHTVVH